MIRPFRLTARARLDLLGIGRYTAQRWAAARKVSGRPGRSLPRPRCLQLFRGVHLEFYVARETGIHTVGVPHQAIDDVTHLAKGRR